MGEFQNRTPREICNFCRPELHEKKFLDSLREAPEETPRVKLEASGFRSTLCMTVPLMESAAPTRKAITALGIRRFQRIDAVLREIPSGRGTRSR